MTPQQREEALGRFLARIFEPWFAAALDVRDEQPHLDDEAVAEEVRRRLAAGVPSGARDEEASPEPPPVTEDDLRKRPRYRPFKRPPPSG